MSSFSQLLNMPDLIQGEPVAVKPKAPVKQNNFSMKDAIDKAVSDARQEELDRTLREIELTASRIQPGPPAGGNVPSYDEQVMNNAAQAKWNKMKAKSLMQARENHAAKYGLPNPNPYGGYPITQMLDDGFGSR